MPVPGTKLHVPVARRRLVARDRLTDALQSDVSTPRLMLVCAPAGFGKTTLLTQWLTGDRGPRAPAADGRASRPLRVAWLSLDPQDSELSRFLANLVAAVKTSSPETEALRIHPDDAATISSLTQAEGLLGQLVNDLDLLPGTTVVCLDDYHVIDDATVHESVSFLLENLPPGASLAITSRADPPLPLARLRARGELLEVRAADLRFTETEAAEFLNDVMGLGLAEEQVSALEQRTEGWVAGLQLAAVSAKSLPRPDSTGGGDLERFVDAFTGSHRFVLDYLVEEVLNRQPHDVGAFLLETSVLDELCAPLCDALTGRPDGQATLERLEQTNLFVVALDHERRWWRYHHLFADALRARLTARDASLVRDLHRRASDWYAAEARLPEAIRHALAGDAPEQAADLIELGIPGMRQRREDRQHREWLEALPADVRRRRPLLACQSAWARLSVGDLDGVDHWLDAAEMATSASPPRAIASGTRALALYDEALGRELDRLPTTIAVYRASASQARGDLAKALEHARRAHALADPTDHFAHGSAAAFLGLLAWTSGDVREAADIFGGAVDDLRAAGNEADALGSAVVLADMRIARGKPQHALEALKQALEAAESHPQHPLSTVGDVHVAMADTLRELNDLQGADRHLAAAFELGERGSLLEYRHRWYTTAAGVLQARGDLDGALAMLDTAQSLFLPGFVPDVRPIAARRARIHIAQGRLADARAWVVRTGMSTDVWSRELSYVHEYEELTLARVRVAELEVAAQRGGGSGGTMDQEVREIHKRLEAIVTSASTGARGAAIVDARLARARLHRACRDVDRALDELAAALTLGVPSGMQRTFLDEGDPVKDLLAALSRTGSSGASVLAAQLLHVPVPAGESVATSAVPPGGQLSDRELEVLRLLATDLSGPEIAAHLFVSVNTLRTHTKHIFTKLDVRTRRAAVRRAEDLTLL